MRRFVYDVPRCPRRVFCERLPGTAAAYARLARELGMPAGASADTLLRVLKSGPSVPRAEPLVRVLGVDDWAWREGRRYSTVLVDFERRRVLDPLPDREAGTLAAWLRAHPRLCSTRASAAKKRAIPT